MRTISYVLFVLTFLAASMRPSAARAQALEPAGARYGAAAPDTVRRTAFLRGDDPGERPTRIILGIVGGIGGVFAGGAIGSRTVGECRGDFCGLDNVITGAALGSIVGSSVLSSIPAMSSPCGFGHRVAVAAAGSLAGALAGGVTGLIGGPFGVVAGFLAGSSIGGGVGASYCR